MTSQRSPDNSGKKCFFTIFDFSGDHSLSSPCARRRSSSCARKRSSIFFLCKKKSVSLHKKKILFLHQEKTFFLHEKKIKSGLHKSERWSQKHFSPEVSRDLWGVICFHHWYLRTSLEGQGEKFFPRCKMTFKMMQNHPLNIFHAWVRLESLAGADLSTFQKIIFSLVWPDFGHIRTPFWSKK